MNPVIQKKYEAVVVGGGLAGLCGAIAAARLGCRVALIQDRPVLGGNSSSEVRVPICGACEFNSWARETGILEELFLEDRMQNARRVWIGQTPSMWDLVLYNAAREEESLDLYLDTSARSVEKDTNRRLRRIHCSQLGSENELAIEGDLFIDATGDGTIAYLAGAETHTGREARNEFNESLAPEKADDYTQGSSLSFHATDMGHPVPFTPPKWAATYRNDADLFFRTHDDLEGGYWWIEIGNPPYNTVRDNQAIRDDLLKHLLGVWDHIKNRGDHGAENLFIDWIGAIPGKRESRRILGDYVLCEADVRTSRLFDDRVAYGGWFIDLHTPGGILAKEDLPEPAFGGDKEEADKRQMSIYSIPFRCLYSRDIDNLMMAGRDISATHVALGTTRLMGTCAVLGEAVGTAAYLCTRHGVSPREIGKYHVHELQQLLLKQDCYIPRIKNEDQSDLARRASTGSSSDAALKFPEGEVGREWFEPRQTYISLSNLDEERAQLFPVTANRIERIDLLVESKKNTEARIDLNLYSAVNIWDFSGTIPIASASAMIPPHTLSEVRFEINQQVDPHHLYWIAVRSEKNVYWLYSNKPPTGTTSATRIIKNWSIQKGAYSLHIYPEVRPYGAENVLSGVSRPESWTNLWISDPLAGFPQYLELEFGQETAFNTVYLTFDTNLNNTHVLTPPLSRAPECVSDYTLYIEDIEEASTWKSILSIKGNYQRRRIHRFDTIRSRKLRFEIRATNGDPSARIYEVRVYREEAPGSSHRPTVREKSTADGKTPDRPNTM